MFSIVSLPGKGVYEEDSDGGDNKHIDGGNLMSKLKEKVINKREAAGVIGN